MKELVSSTTSETSVELAFDSKAPSLARQFIEDANCVHEKEILEIAQLLISEVVTNAVRHGIPPLKLDVCCAEHKWVEIKVEDSSHDVPTRKEPGIWSESGRGLELVERLSDAWGVEPTAHGKTVWFRLNL